MLLMQSPYPDMPTPMIERLDEIENAAESLLLGILNGKDGREPAENLIRALIQQYDNEIEVPKTHTDNVLRLASEYLNAYVSSEDIHEMLTDADFHNIEHAREVLDSVEYYLSPTYGDICDPYIEIAEDESCSVLCCCTDVPCAADCPYKQNN